MVGSFWKHTPFALQHRKTQVDIDGADGKVALRSWLRGQRPTILPQQPAFLSSLRSCDGCSTEAQIPQGCCQFIDVFEGVVQRQRSPNGTLQTKAAQDGLSAVVA
jgi:hypothetical protein